MQKAEKSWRGPASADKDLKQKNGGVDRCDQNISIYRFSIKSKKWWWAFLANNAMQGLCDPCEGCPYGNRTDLAAGAVVAPHGLTARV